MEDLELGNSSNEISAGSRSWLGQAAEDDSESNALRSG
jgi:hypothetical protein